MNIEAIDFLNRLNESGAIDYASYSHLHDFLTSEEPEWEYGVGWHWDGRMIAFSTHTRAAAEKYIERHPEDDDFGSHILVQRQPERAAGDWVPVKS